MSSSTEDNFHASSSDWQQGHEAHHKARVRIPDLFVSFLAQEPQINPMYEDVKGESIAWIAQLCHYDEESYKKHLRADLPYFVSIWARDAGPEQLRTICDWMHWVFDFDDMFDEGCFKGNKEEAVTRVKDLVDVMESTSPSALGAASDPLLEAFESVWIRVVRRSSEGARRRFVQTMIEYTEGVVNQLNVVSPSEQLDEQRFLALRRQSIGAGPCFALIEYFYGLDLPEKVFENLSVQRLDRIARELIVIQNDALSFLKELAGGHDQNLVSLYGRLGIAPQEAYDRIDVLLKERYCEWYLAQASLPQWGETLDRQVQKYIRAVQDVVTANLYWSFHTSRYFGRETEKVRHTRIINVPCDQLIKTGLTIPQETSIGSTINGGELRSLENATPVTDAETMTDHSPSPNRAQFNAGTKMDSDADVVAQLDAQDGIKEAAADEHLNTIVEIAKKDALLEYRQDILSSQEPAISGSRSQYEVHF